MMGGPKEVHNSETVELLSAEITTGLDPKAVKRVNAEASSGTLQHESTLRYHSDTYIYIYTDTKPNHFTRGNKHFDTNTKLPCQLD